MKHLFKILLALIFFSLINLGYAIPPKQHNRMIPALVAVQVTIHNKSSAASLKFWDFSYARSFPSMSLHMPVLFPVNPNSSGPLSIKIPIQQPAISASLSYGYDFSNFCQFLFSYSNNQLTVTPTPYGGVNCGKPAVSGESVTLTINQRGQQQQQSATNYIHFTIVNDSSKSLKYYKLPIVSPNWLGPMSISPSLATIPANSSLSFTATINHSLPTGTSVQIDYGIDRKNFCTFSLPIHQLKTKATVIKTTTKSTKYHMICTVGNDNSMHVNVQLPSDLGAKCNQSGNWSYSSVDYANTSVQCSNLICYVAYLGVYEASKCGGQALKDSNNTSAIFGSQPWRVTGIKLVLSKVTDQQHYTSVPYCSATAIALIGSEYVGGTSFFWSFSAYTNLPPAGNSLRAACAHVVSKLSSST